MLNMCCVDIASRRSKNLKRTDAELFGTCCQSVSTRSQTCAHEFHSVRFDWLLAGQFLFGIMKILPVDLRERVLFIVIDIQVVKRERELA